jgi:hypothetical protein
MPVGQHNFNKKLIFTIRTPVAEMTARMTDLPLKFAASVSAALEREAVIA